MDLFPPTLHHKKIISYTLTYDGQNEKKKKKHFSNPISTLVNHLVSNPARFEHV